MITSHSFGGFQAQLSGFGVSHKDSWVVAEMSHLRVPSFP